MENKLEATKHYILNVTILEARHLDVVNANTIVVVSVGKHRKRVHAKTKKTENPFFNEIFRFPFYEPLQELLRYRLRLSVYKAPCFLLVGQCDVELATVWLQSGHQFFHKWAVLSDPKDPVSGIKGYLKCNIQILGEGIPPVPPPSVNGTNEIQDNLLVPIGIYQRRQNALFTVNIYRADGIVCKKEQCGQEVESSCKDMFVKVEFAGRTEKTTTARNSLTPTWNEAVHFLEAVPSLFQTISIEVWDKRSGLMIGSASLPLVKLCIANNALPSFGPSFLYLFKRQDSRPSLMALAGRILISLHCELLERGNIVKLQKMHKLSPFDETLLPPYEQFTLFMAVFNCLFFKKKYFHKCVVCLNHGSNFTQTFAKKDATTRMLTFKTNYSCIALKEVAKVGNSYFSWNSSGNIPAAHTTASWPSFQEKEQYNNYTKNLLQEILSLTTELHQVHILGDINEAHRKGKEILLRMNEACDKLLHFRTCTFETHLEKARKTQNQKLLIKIKNEIHKIVVAGDLVPENILPLIQNSVATILAGTESVHSTFPNFEIAIKKESSNKKRTQIWLRAEDYLYSTFDKETGTNCARLNTLFMRDSRGHEVVALDVLLWFGKTIDLCDTLKLHREAIKENNDLDLIRTLHFEEKHLFELRVHIYQGQINPGSDASGLADPFVRVFALGQDRETHVKSQTLDPFWDETLLFSQITLFGEGKFIRRESIGVIFEILDYDGKDKADLIGRGVVRPKVHLLGNKYSPPRLNREFVYMCGEEAAEVLLAMELIEVASFEDRPLKPPSQNKIFSIPDEIRPHFTRFLFEVIFWGIRSIKSTNLPPAPKVMALMECNGVKVESSLVRAQDSLNFEYQVQKVYIPIPTEEEYAPPLSVRLYTFNFFNKASYKGGILLPFVTRFISNSKPQNYNNISLNINFNNSIEESRNDMYELDETPDWWTKYYASKVGQRDKRKMMLYKSELEKQPEFGGFKDFLFPFDLLRGKSDLQQSMASLELVGTAKCCIRLHRQESFLENSGYIPDTFSSYPRNDPLDITVRVYIVAAFDLTPTDINGRCDPYISLSLGQVKVSDRKNYIYKETSPVFGKYYELKGTFPWDHTLLIRILDHNLCLADNLIGETSIDLENRFYTKHRAICGVSDTYENNGYCQWRDFLQPTEILEQICQRSQYPKPVYDDKNVRIGKFSIASNSDKKENIALKILRNFHKIPELGFYLVPEHVETRYLFHPRKPCTEQGKLEMWVDIFPGHSSLPPPVNITPREPQNLELRVIVWNTSDVLPVEVNLITHEKSSDIYVKAWLVSPNASQRTDTHYRSLTGEGSFNWRFVFPFIYSPVDHKMIIWKNEAFSGEPWKEKVPCTLEVQVWDNDLLSDDFIGSLSLNLWNMPKGAKSARECTLDMLDCSYSRLSLFRVKKSRGWWPFSAKVGKKTKTCILAGKIDMELEILTEEEARTRPVGIGRDDPCALPEPKRPSTTFFSTFNHLSLVKKLAFGGVGRKLLIFSGASALVVFFLAGWLALPGILLKKWIAP